MTILSENVTFRYLYNTGFVDWLVLLLGVVITLVGTAFVIGGRHNSSFWEALFITFSAGCFCSPQAF